jgi:hypothetical protein
MAMTEMNFPLVGEDAHDDLPRTLRREREARERQAREREARAREPMQSGLVGRMVAAARPAYATSGEAPSPSVVRDFDVPFARLVAFFLKAALAAVPGVLLLGFVLWVIGQGLQAFFPDLVKLQILIWFPN